MLTTFIIVALLALALLIAGVGKISYVSDTERDKAAYNRGYEPKRTEHNIRLFAVVPLAFAVFLAAYAMTYKVSTGEAVIKVSPGGAYLATDASPGYHSKAPWTETVTWDLRNNRVEFYDGERDGEKAAAGTIRTATSDPVDTWFDMTVTYDLQASGLAEAYRQYSSQENLEKEQIVPAFSSKAKDAPTTYPATQIRASRPELSQKIQGDLTSRLQVYGVNVSNVDLQEINLPKNVVDNLNTVQAKAAAAEAKRSELAGAEIDAEKARVSAKGEADADQITRCGATTQVVTENVNGKPTQVTRVLPNQVCDPNRLNASVLTARYIQMLQARQGDTTFVLPPDANTLLNLGGAPAAAK